MIDLHNAVYTLLKPTADAMKLNLIHAYQNAERVKKPYASIRIDTSVAPNHEMYFPVNENGYQDYGNFRRAMIEVQVYGKSAGLGARRFALSLKSQSSLNLATQYNLAICTNMFLSEVPEMINLSQYEERGIYQFQLYYADQLDDNVGIIERVEIGYVEEETEWDGGMPDKDCTTVSPVTGLESPCPPGETIWDDGETVWDEVEHCKTVITAFPPYTPPKPTP